MTRIEAAAVALILALIGLMVWRHWPTFVAICCPLSE